MLIGKYIKSKGLFWGLLVIFYTFFLGIPLWFQLERMFPVDENAILSLMIGYDFYIAQRAFVGLFLLSLISLLSSFLKGNTTSLRSILKDKSSYGRTNNFSQINFLGLIFSIRIALSIFLGIHWYNMITHVWFPVTGFVFGYNFLFGLWSLLFIINVICASYIIIFEPWWSLTTHLIANVPGVLGSKVSSLQELDSIGKRLLLVLYRLIKYIALYLLLFLFASAKFPTDHSVLWISTILLIFWRVSPCVKYGAGSIMDAAKRRRRRAMPDYTPPFVNTQTGYWISTKRPKGLINWWKYRRYYVGVRPCIEISIRKEDDRARDFEELRIVERYPGYEHPYKTAFSQMKKTKRGTYLFQGKKTSSLSGGYAAYIGTQFSGSEVEPIMTADIIHKDIVRRDVDLVVLGILAGILLTYFFHLWTGI